MALKKCIFALFFLIAAPALAAEQVASAAGGAVEYSFVDRTQGALSQAVENVARKLDSFFGTEIAYEESTGTYCKLSGLVRLTEGGEWDYAFATRVKLVLPLARKKFRLVLERDPDVEDGDGDDGPGDQTLTEAREDNYQAALAYVFNETQKWKATANAGVRVKWPPDPFVRVTGRRYIDLDLWRLRLEQRLEYSREEHFVSKTSFNADHSLGQGVLYRYLNSAKYGSDEDNFDLLLSNTIAHTISSRDAMAYSAGVAWVTRPEFWVDNYSVAVAYRRKLYSDWLFGELSPRVDWPRDHHFKSVASVSLKLELLIGADTGINGK